MDKLIQNEIDECLRLLPERYHTEFIKDVIECVDEEDMTVKSVRKSFEYYLADIMDELTTEEMDKIEEVVFMIRL